MKRKPASRTLLAACLGSSLAVAPLCLPAAAQVGQSATQVLLDKAHTLEVKGRMDMAAQTWQQVLLSDPNNTEALSGLARAAKLSGNGQLSASYLERLRAINPNDPGILRAEKVATDDTRSAQLQQAGKYAEAGQYAQAMGIYRKVFGETPPPGDWALAYYETEAATEAGRPHAVSGLHALVEHYPADSRYQIALGRILTYNPKTRAEGRRYLEKHPSSQPAMEALRQSLVWDSANPASAGEIRAYLAKHNDAQLAAALRNQPKTASKPAAGREADAPAPDSPELIASRARGQEVEGAYKALNAKQLEEAETRFKAILATDPENARALAGLGYIRMQQSNFGAAISFLDQAKQNGAKDAGLDPALTTARFWFTMGEASTSLKENDLTTAEQQYQAALAMRPTSPEALEGLGGTLLKAQQSDAATQVFEQLVKLKPNAPGGWRGLFQSYYSAGNSPQALLTERRIPPAVHAQLMRDPDFLRNLASAYSAVGRDADAQRVLRSALDLPFPADASRLKIETQLQFAALLQQANHVDQAAGLYRQVLAADMSNTGAWQGLVRAEHAMKSDEQALQTLESMPPATHEAAMRDVGFQSTVASVYQGANKLEMAQQVLEHAVTQQTAANQKPSVGLELQLAGIYLSRNNTQQAYPIYRQVLAENSDRPDAWKGILAALHGSGHDQEALAQAQQIPAGLKRQLEADPEYLQTVGAIYNGLGQPRQAMAFINRVQQHYTAQNAAPPSDIDVQDAWLLFNSGNDAGLYRQLMLLGGRPDLSDEQRRTVQTIWTNWAVRRANQAAGAGDQKRSLAILNAAAKAFPDNPGVLRALAAGYARAGLPKQAVLIYKSQDMTAATASDYKSAVGAALASADQKDAETWLRFGLDAYPKDAQMLTLGAKFEQAHGNSGRAADYFRASLAALPPGDPGAELAGELSQPMPAVRLPSATQSQDLATLLSTGGDTTLNGGAQAQNAQVDRPYLPNYGNLSGQPPVTLGSEPSPGQGVVPSYMANPAYRASPPAGGRGTLKDYVPTAKLEDRALPGVTNTGETASPPPSTFADVRKPIFTPVPASGTSPFTGEVAPATPRQMAVIPTRDIYGPYVPYTAPAGSFGYTPAPVPVQLGNAAPEIGPAQREVTDVLPTPRYLPNAPYTPGRTAVSGGSQPPTENAQFVAPRQTGDSFGQQYPQPDVAAGGSGTRRRRSSTGTATSSAYTPAPAQPLSYPNVASPLSSGSYPSLPAAASEGVPPTDAELTAKNVPPLRGSYDPGGGVVPAGKSQREQTELELATLEASYSGWIGGTGVARYRSGTPGFDRLIDIEAPIEASAVLGKTVRATVVPRPVFLNSGVIDTAGFQNNTGTIPILGTLSGNATVAPAQQFSSGIGGEFQLTTTNLGVAAGYTPYNFLVSNITARAQWRPFGGHITLFGDRDSVKDTQLSYAGLRDPGSISNVFAGNIWGGVISTTGGLRIDVGGEKSGLYISGDGGVIEGYHVLDNKKYEGTMGAYFRAHRWPGYGTLNVGGNFFAMHYDQNERGMTYGQGGYFSPNVYFLASVPVTYTGYYKSDFHYSINGSVGVQTFQEASAPYYPLDQPLQLGAGNAYYGQNSSTGLNYGLNAEGSYRIADHWYVGGFASANNSRNYNTVNGGFFVRYLFKQQVSTEDYPTGLFPVSGFRPLRVP